MLEIRLAHRFPGFHLDLDIRAPAQGITVVFGPSGCGKSTLLAAVAGLLRPDSGRIAIDGRTLLDTAQHLAIPAERRRCGVVFQDARLFPHLSVDTNLRYGLRRAPEEPGPGFDDVVDLLGLRNLLRRRPRALSGGERQRVALGRALLARPRLLLLDEPLAALDTPRRREIMPFLAEIWPRYRIPMLYVTHALDEVDRLADTLLLLDRGKLLASGPLEQIALRTDLPLAARDDSGAVLACMIHTHDPAASQTRLAFPGGTLLVPLQPAPIGTQLRIRIRDRDITIATEIPRGVSVQNVLEARIATIAATGHGEAVLHLDIPPSALLARITTGAVERLGLQPGQTVWAMIKAVTIGIR